MAAIHKAVLFVALAVIGDIPVNIKVGNVIKLPPPAIALQQIVIKPVTRTPSPQAMRRLRYTLYDWKSL
jgi:hypothetical protein